MRTVSCKPNDGQLSTVKDDTALQEWTVDSVSCSSSRTITTETRGIAVVAVARKGYPAPP
ncbi:hypothetical protein BH23GEM7_BH23GEM7_25090 [soil metagenome]